MFSMYEYRPASDETRRKMSEAQKRRLGIPMGFRKIAGEIVAEADVPATLKRLYPCARCGVARSPTAVMCLNCRHAIAAEGRAERLTRRRTIAEPPAPRAPKRPSMQRQRVLNGQCPTCGKDAAPYRLCSDHRALASISRLLNRWEKAGAVTKSRDGGANRWKATPNMHEVIAELPVRKMPLWEGGDDARTRPRLRGMPVDVEATVVDILRNMGRPASVEEIQAAWGRLRGERKHGSLAADIGRIIEAQRRRDERAARRAHNARGPEGK